MSVLIPVVRNVREGVGRKDTKDMIYVGRPTKWGNPYKEGPDGTRDDVVELFRAYILENLELLEDLHELRGKDLICWCAPEKCHADVLLELANNE